MASLSSMAQDDNKTLHETAKGFMRSGDFDNAVIVLTRALQQDNNNLELQKDLVMSYYLKRDYVKALDGVKKLVDREDADVICFQLAGNVYKALEEAKEFTAKLVICVVKQMDKKHLAANAGFIKFCPNPP